MGWVVSTDGWWIYSLLLVLAWMALLVWGRWVWWFMAATPVLTVVGMLPFAFLAVWVQEHFLLTAEERGSCVGAGRLPAECVSTAFTWTVANVVASGACWIVLLALTAVAQAADKIGSRTTGSLGDADRSSAPTSEAG